MAAEHYMWLKSPEYRYDYVGNSVLKFSPDILFWHNFYVGYRITLSYECWLFNMFKKHDLRTLNRANEKTLLKSQTFVDEIYERADDCSDIFTKSLTFYLKTRTTTQ